MDRFAGCFVGLAIGDSLGAAVECMNYKSFEEVKGMRAGGKYSLLAGQFTDDTSLALCMAESIVQKKGELDYQDMHAKFRAYYEQGHLTSTGECFDIGKCTLQGMNKFKATGNVFSGGTEDYCSGNGSIMRLAPIPMLFAYKDEVEGVERCAETSRLTHGGKFAVDCCKLQGLIIMYFLQEKLTKEDLFSKTVKEWAPHISLSLDEQVEALLPGNFAEKNFPGDIVNSGFSLKALEAALWAFYHTSSFAAGVLKVVNMGDDADTVAAIYGQIAGAYYGLSAIPQEWINTLSFSSLISALSRDIYELAQGKEALEENKELYEIFSNMQEDFRVLYKRFSPGPAMYSSVAQFDKDTGAFVEKYKEKGDAKEFLQNYQNLFASKRIVVAQRTSRPKLPFALKQIH